MIAIADRLGKLLKPETTLALVAVLAGAGGAIMAGRYVNGRIDAAHAEVERRFAMRPVVVAARDLRRGDLLERETLASRAVPGDFVPPDAVPVDQAAAVLGERIAVDISRGSPIVRASLISGGARPQLSSELAPGERALTIAVNDVSSQAGGLRAGDRVDLFYAGSENGEAMLVPLLQQIELLAAGEFLSWPAGAGTSGGGFTTVTLRVRAEDAPRVLLAQEAGQILLLLRAPADESRPAGSIRSSRELLRPAPRRTGTQAGMELLVGGAGQGGPQRSWLTAARGGAVAGSEDRP